MLYLGIDQHHKQLTISIRSDEGTVILKRQVSTQPDRVRAFLDDVRRQAGDDGFMAVLEVCGFNDWLIALLHEYGCREVVLIHPEKHSRRKTDRRDAAKLSELLWLNGERLRQGQKPQGLRRVVVPSADDQADRQLTALRRRCLSDLIATTVLRRRLVREMVRSNTRCVRKRVGQQRTRSINKMKNRRGRLINCDRIFTEPHFFLHHNVADKPRERLRRHNLSWQQPTKTFQTQAVRRWLAELELPEIDRLEMDQLLAQWKLWEEQRKQLEERIAHRFHKNKAAQILATAPGGGAYSALAIASRIGRVERFPRPRSLANYCGLTPGCRGHRLKGGRGEATDRLGSITKQGSGMVRFIVGQMVLHALKKDPYMREWYRRIHRRRGSKIARVAVMRRLVTIFWHMLTHEKSYTVGGPPRLRLKAAQRKQELKSA